MIFVYYFKASPAGPAATGAKFGMMWHKLWSRHIPSQFTVVATMHAIVNQVRSGASRTAGSTVILMRVASKKEIV